MNAISLSDFHQLTLLQYILDTRFYCSYILLLLHDAVAEWLRAWDTLTMFEAMVCGRS